MVNFLFTHSPVLDKIKRFTKSEKLTPQQHNMLLILRDNKTPTSTLQLRERMLDKMSDTSRIVNRLITKKLVKKRNSKKDKRFVEISILPPGLMYLANRIAVIKSCIACLIALQKKKRIC
ncbi:MAG TPA: helix-turn-helix domain-containing protein [Chitinophagaceae bacterium]|nr:helix-turn-helix domain-containing protein [Chitinophagaceae bacterium]